MMGYDHQNPSHYRNVLSVYFDEIGGGIFDSGSEIYCARNFCTRQDAPYNSKIQVILFVTAHTLQVHRSK